MTIYFELALNEAMQGIENGDGAPFGACIVNNDQVIALAHDTVLKEKDATCHAERIALVLRELDKIKFTFSISSWHHLYAFFTHKSSMDNEYTCAFVQS